MAKSNSSGSFSVIGADIVITGDISASTELHVDGTINGDMTCASLVQGEGSSVKRRDQGGKSARLAGTVDGSIDARELVILRSATIKGDVHYDALTIEQGAQVDGRFAPRGSGNAKAQSPLAPKADGKLPGDEPAALHRYLIVAAGGSPPACAMSNRELRLAKPCGRACRSSSWAILPGRQWNRHARACRRGH